MERLHILDGYGYIFRAYYGLMTGGPNRQAVRMSTAGGMPTGALYVYATMLIRLHLDVKPERIAVVYDAPGPSFRSEIDDQYKATRTEMPDDLKVQMPYFRPLTEAFCWPVLSVPGSRPTTSSQPWCAGPGPATGTSPCSRPTRT
jgi:5'-3' exonuclease